MNENRYKTVETKDLEQVAGGGSPFGPGFKLVVRNAPSVLGKLAGPIFEGVKYWWNHPMKAY